jgi:hypothetical protein
MLTIEWIVSCVREQKYSFSRHADEERMNDNLLIAEIEKSIVSGAIL